LREREELLHFSATRDALTGLRNTTSCKSWVEEFVKITDGKPVDYGVMVFDLNDLKKTNDKYGHDMGNKLIIVAAKIIPDTFKRSPVFRIGGDEFAVVLQNSDLEIYEELLEKFDLSCANAVVHKNAQIPVRVACGFARFDPSRDIRFADVFKRADEAMYENKRKMKTE
jgi:diguanylate cyclase (GGDEF)-like protein